MTVPRALTVVAVAFLLVTTGSWLAGAGPRPNDCLTVARAAPAPEAGGTFAAACPIGGNRVRLIATGFTEHESISVVADDAPGAIRRDWSASIPADETGSLDVEVQIAGRVRVIYLYGSSGRLAITNEVDAQPSR